MLGIAVNVMLGASQAALNWPRPVELSEGALEKLDISGNIASNVATGFFNHPNGLALLLIPAFVMLFGLFYQRIFRGLVVNFVMLCFLSLSSFALIFSQAKGAIAWIGIGVLFVILSKSVPKLRYQLGLIVLLFGIWSMSYYGYVKSIKQTNMLSTVLTRINLWQAALKVISEHHYIKFFGNGFSEMRVASFKVANWEYPNSHNGILNQILFFGFPACILYFFTYLDAIKKLQVSFSTASPYLQAINVSLCAALIALFGDYFFEPANDGVVYNIQFFVLIALANIISRANSGSEQLA
jgi:hypothetical protein